MVLTCVGVMLGIVWMKMVTAQVCRVFLKGHCRASRQLYEKLEDVFALTEFQN